MNLASGFFPTLLNQNQVLQMTKTAVTETRKIAKKEYKHLIGSLEYGVEQLKEHGKDIADAASVANPLSRDRFYDVLFHLTFNAFSSYKCHLKGNESKRNNRLNNKISNTFMKL